MNDRPPTLSAPRLLFRVDLDPAAGRWRLERCLRLAEEWPGKCAAATVGSSEAGAGALQARGVGVVPLRAGEPLSRAEELAELAGRHGVAALVLDSPEIAPRVEGVILGAGLPVVRLDDGAEHNPYRCHVLVNPGLGAESLAYATTVRTARLLGPRYHPVCRSLREAPRAAPASDRVERVLVALGPGEEVRLLPRLLEALDDRSGARLRVRIPLAAGAAERARALVERSRHDVSIDADPATLAPYLRTADVALVGATHSRYDVAAAGLPALFCSLSPAWAEEGRRFAEHGVCRSAEATSAALDRALDELLALTAAERAEMAEAGRALVDGRGAARIGEALLERLG